jgi:molybdopterin-guanine dinucleotide biosynthesis protein A
VAAGRGVRAVSGPISVAVLAGGMSRRLGQDKALVRLLPGDPTLLELVLAAVKPIGDDVFVVASNRPEYTGLGVPLRPDLYPNAGVLGGIGSALRHAQGERCLVVSCDHPFLSTALLGAIAGRNTEADVVVPVIAGESRQGGRIIRQTLHTVYGHRCVEPIERAIGENRFQVISFFGDVRVAEIDAEQLRVYDPELWSFFSVNTPEALGIAIQHRAERLEAERATD